MGTECWEMRKSTAKQLGETALQVNATTCNNADSCNFDMCCSGYCGAGKSNVVKWSNEMKKFLNSDKGSSTVECAILIPVILASVLLCIYIYNSLRKSCCKAMPTKWPVSLARSGI